MKEFSNLPEEIQATYIMDVGKFLLRYESTNYAIDLYAVHNYFVEVLYDYHEQNISGFRSVNDMKDLEKYFDLIDLEVFV